MPEPTATRLARATRTQFDRRFRRRRSAAGPKQKAGRTHKGTQRHRPPRELAAATLRCPRSTVLLLVEHDRAPTGWRSARSEELAEDRGCKGPLKEPRFH
eukprot:7385017-Prymnesium_polylepis.1